MKCSIKGCPGEYEARVITHTVRPGGHVVVIDHVPAEVCSVCGDTLLQPKTIRQLEARVSGTVTRHRGQASDRTSGTVSGRDLMGGP
jgi:YgiT-type zinc finger domain-containing protein